MDERPLHHRILALLALVALLLAGGVSSCWIITDQVRKPAPLAAGEDSGDR
jgi:hypothetical protein